jgi:replication factor C large subunit
MTHHCKPRELTVAMAAWYDFDASHVAYVTGSGESTNKVQSIVADARERREELVEEHGGDAFARRAGETEGLDAEADAEADADTSTDDTDDGAAGATLDGVGDGDDADETDDDDAGRDDGQSGLSDFA